MFSSATVTIPSFFVAGKEDTSGEINAEPSIEGTSVLAMLSCASFDDFVVGGGSLRFVFVRFWRGVPGVMLLRPGRRRGTPFSFVTRPLSWTYLEERRW